MPTPELVSADIKYYNPRDVGSHCVVGVRGTDQLICFYHGCTVKSEKGDYSPFLENGGQCRGDVKATKSSWDAVGPHKKLTEHYSNLGT